MKYKNHTIELYPPELCILDPGINDDKTWIGFIAGEIVNSKIYLYNPKGKEEAYKILKLVLDKQLGDMK